MFGSLYAEHHDVLWQSFGEMNETYRRKGFLKVHSGIRFALVSLYIRAFGIPEIGFQLRALYFRRALRAISGVLPTRILDAGSGIGAYSIWLAHAFPAAEVVGCDIDETKIATSKKLARELQINNLKFVCADLTRSTLGNNDFDMIISIDVLEHLANYESALQEFGRLLKPAGYLYLHTPQPEQRRIFKRFDRWRHENHVTEGFAPAHLSEALTRLGFSVVTLKQTFGFFGKLAWELNHLALGRSFVPAGVTFPFLYLLAKLDPLLSGQRSLGTAILAKKLAQ